MSTSMKNIEMSTLSWDINHSLTDQSICKTNPSDELLHSFLMLMFCVQMSDTEKTCNEISFFDSILLSSCIISNLLLSCFSGLVADAMKRVQDTGLHR